MTWKIKKAPGWAVVGLFLIAAFGAVAAARDFLMPVTMAVLLFFVFTPLRRWLEKRGIPQAATAGIVSVGLFVLLCGIMVLLLGPLTQLAEQMPQFASRIEAKMGDVTGPLLQLRELTERIDQIIGAENADGPGTSSAEFLMRVVEVGPIFFTQLIFVLLLLYFMMASGDLLYLKIVQSFGTLGSKRQAYSALRTIEQSLGSYFSTITLINAGLGTCIGLAMWVWDLPAPFFFGLMAFMLNFIPYFGLAIGTVVVTFVALVTLDGFFVPLLVGATYAGISSIEGQLITPTLVSRRLSMNTVVVFLAVALWAWLWSVVGMIVAVPLLVVARVLCDHIPGMDRLGNFLGGEDPAPLGPEEREEKPAEPAPPEPAQLAPGAPVGP